MRINFIDNYYSFPNTIMAYFRLAGADVTMYKSDCSLETAVSGSPDLILLGPGPNGPDKAGNYLDLLDKYHQKIPFFGICLGFQAIMMYFGKEVEKLDDVVHGSLVDVYHTRSEGIFKGIDKVAAFSRYNSLGVYGVPSCFEVTATTKTGLVMAAKHKDLSIQGVQFHPESVLSVAENAGMRLLENLVRSYQK